MNDHPPTSEEVTPSGPRTGDPYIDRFLPRAGSFEDRIYAVAMAFSVDEMDMAWMSDVARNVLAMPEMQAIRSYLRDDLLSSPCISGDPYEAGARWGLPTSVISWVVEPARTEVQS